VHESESVHEHDESIPESYIAMVGLLLAQPVPHWVALSPLVMPTTPRRAVWAQQQFWAQPYATNPVSPLCAECDATPPGPSVIQRHRASRRTSTGGQIGEIAPAAGAKRESIAAGAKRESIAAGASGNQSLPARSGHQSLRARSGNQSLRARAGIIAAGAKRASIAAGAKRASIAAGASGHHRCGREAGINRCGRERASIAAGAKRAVVSSGQPGLARLATDVAE
jgi:hypothetical protein